MDLSHLTGTELLRRAGYGHAAVTDTLTTGRHLIYRLPAGEPLCRMDAHEASAFAIAMLRRVSLTFDGWDVPRTIPRSDDPHATAALRILVKAVQRLNGDDEDDIAGAGLDAAIDNATQVLERIDSQAPVSAVNTDDERAQLVDDMLDGLDANLADVGLPAMPEEMRERTAEFLTGLLDELHSVDRATRLGVDPRLIHGGE